MSSTSSLTGWIDATIAASISLDIETSDESFG
jgi:hypothetical protein